jgi:AraC-like DNA-binding protein
MKPTASKPTTAATTEFFSNQVREAKRFYLDLKPLRTQALAVVCGGIERTTPEYTIRRASFPFYSIEYVLRGRGRAKLGHDVNSLRAGSVLSYGPGVSQDISSEPSEPLVKYLVDFAGTKARALLVRCALGPGKVSQMFPPDELQAIFDELIREGLRGSKASDEICTKLLECLMLRIGESRAPTQAGKSLAFKTYHESRRHIEDHFRRLKTLEQISAECRVNNAYLCRLFRAHGGRTPYQLLLHLKMNLAAELLQAGVLVKQVAEQIGFGDAFHFSRAFKKRFGMAPDAFRKLR